MVEQGEGLLLAAFDIESEVFCHRDYLDFEVPGVDVDFTNVVGLQENVDKWRAEDRSSREAQRLAEEALGESSA